MPRDNDLMSPDDVITCGTCHSQVSAALQTWTDADRREQRAWSATVFRCSEAILALRLIVMTTCDSAVFSVLFSERSEPTSA